jgi:hypothetical protein
MRVQGAGLVLRRWGRRSELTRNSRAACGREACVAAAGVGDAQGVTMGEDDFHPDTRMLLKYGRALAGAGPRPKGGDGADHLLERLFVVERMRSGRLPLRVFGAELAGLFGRDLKDADFGGFWHERDLRLLNALLDNADDANAPAIARVFCDAAAGRQWRAELLLTPLRVEPNLGERYLGLFQALGGQAFAAGAPILRLRLGSLHPPLAPPPPGVRLVVSND